MRLIGAGDGETDGLGSCRQQQPVIGNFVAAGDDDFASTNIDLYGCLPHARIDAVVSIEAIIPQRYVVEGNGAREVVLRQVGPVIWQGIVAAEHDDAVLVTASTEHFRGRKPGGAATDDDNLFRLADRRLAAWLRDWLLPLFAHRDLPVALLDVPACYWAERRRPERLSRAQIETGVVPGATHRVANHETLGERPLIMGTLGTDCEHLPAAAHQQNLLVAGMTEEHSAIGELIESDALGKVWTGELLFFLHHRGLPSRSRIASFAPRPLRGQSIMLRNSCRVSGLSRKQPSIRLVTRSVSGLCTPRVVMQ